MLCQDPPDHTRLRALVSRAFTPRVVELMRPHIQEIVDGLLDRVEGARAMDVIEDLASPLPVTRICELVGDLRPPHIQKFLDGLLDRVEGARAMDVIEDLAYPLPVTVICEMLGVPAS